MQRPDYVERRGPGWLLIRHTNSRGASQLHLVRYDVADTKLVEKFTWRVTPDYRTYYARASVPSRLTKRYGTHITMHQLLMRGRRRKGMRIAHLNGNGLDNRRENLAWMTQEEVLARLAAARNTRA